MAVTLFDYTRFREPNLLMPGKKPIGLVRVDRSNHIGSSVVAGNIFNGSGDFSGTQGSLYSDAAIKANDLSLSVGWGEAEANADHYRVETSIVPDTIAAAKYSITVRARRTVSSNDVQLCSCGSAENGDLVAAWSLKTTGNVGFTTRIGTTWRVLERASSAATSLDWHIYTITYDDANIEFYVDGVSIGTRPYTDTATASGQKTYVGAAKISSVSQNMYGEDCEIAFYVMNNVCFSAAEVKKLHLDPYQFLVPA